MPNPLERHLENEEAKLKNHPLQQNRYREQRSQSEIGCICVRTLVVYTKNHWVDDYKIERATAYFSFGLPQYETQPFSDILSCCLSAIHIFSTDICHFLNSQARLNSFHKLIFLLEPVEWLCLLDMHKQLCLSCLISQKATCLSLLRHKRKPLAESSHLPPRHLCSLVEGFQWSPVQHRLKHNRMPLSRHSRLNFLSRMLMFPLSSQTALKLTYFEMARKGHA